MHVQGKPTVRSAQVFILTKQAFFFPKGCLCTKLQENGISLDATIRARSLPPLWQ